MKRLIHTPGLMLIAFCGLICSLLSWDAAEDWLVEQWNDLWKRCQ